MDHAHHLHHLTNLGAFAYFLLGLTGSWHCVGMCGPLSVLLLTQNKSSHLSILSLYHAGRVVVYTLLGLLLASLGLSFHGILPQSVLLTLLIIPLLFYAFGISLPLPNTLQKLSLNLHAKIKNLHPYKRAILIGVFTPLLPCGLLYAALAGVSVLGVLFWSFVSWEKALMVGVSILVVTCPCSIGIAMPLARLWLQRHLSSLGVVLKNERLIDEWLSLKHIFLDKTGTLTYDKLILKNESEIQKLTEMDKKILYNLSARSLHPASLAIFQSMASHQFEPLKMEVNEVAGIGLYTTYNGERYFLGKGEHGDNQNLNDTYLVVFSKENSTLASFILEETMLENLAYTVEKLIHEGKRLTLISGDQQQRVRAMAQVLGLGSEDAIGGLTPEKKADLVATTQVGSMMIGDGLNDRLALKQADLAGSPIWERAALAADIDFYFISTGLGWLSQLTPMIKIYKKVLRQNIGFAWIYNGLAISLALMGWITPLICAVIMPLGSLFIVSLTAYKMRRIV